MRVQAKWLRLLLLLRKLALKMAFNILTTKRVPCFGQYDRIDDLITCNLCGDKRPVLRQLLIDESYFAAVVTCFDPLVIRHFRVSSGRDQCFSAVLCSKYDFSALVPS